MENDRTGLTNAVQDHSPEGERLFELGKRDRWKFTALFLLFFLLTVASDRGRSGAEFGALLQDVMICAWGSFFYGILFSRQRLVIGRDSVTLLRPWGSSRIPFADLAEVRYFRGLVHTGTLTGRDGETWDVKAFPWNGGELAEAFRLVERRSGLRCAGLVETGRRSLLEAVREATGLTEPRRVRAWIRRHLFQYRPEEAADAGPALHAPLRLLVIAWIPLTLMLSVSLSLLEGRFGRWLSGSATSQAPLAAGSPSGGLLAWLLGATALSAFVSSAGVILATNILFLLIGRQARQKEALETQLEAARRVQQDLQPRSLPAFPGLEISGTCVPAQEVGGDYYDFIPLEDGSLVVAVGDVSGKGLGACLLMTMTKGSLRTGLRTAASLPEALAAVNRELKHSARAGSFVTLALVRLVPGSGAVEVTRAGHMPPLLVAAGGGDGRWIRPAGLALGLDGGRLFALSIQPESVALSPGDVLVIYSDGVTEAMDPGGNELGEERFRRVVESVRALPAEAIRERVLEEVASFRRGAPVNDDLTLVVLRRTGSPNRSALT